jgi:hypothetical protein
MRTCVKVALRSEPISAIAVRSSLVSDKGHAHPGTRPSGLNPVDVHTCGSGVDVGADNCSRSFAAAVAVAASTTTITSNSDRILRDTDVRPDVEFKASR